MRASDLQSWAALGTAFVAAVLLLRIVLRYERTSIADLRDDRAADRDLIDYLRDDLAAALRRDGAAEERVARLEAEVAAMKLNLRGLGEKPEGLAGI